MNLQAQLASLKEQAAQCIINSYNTLNPNGDNHYPNFPQDVQSWWQSFQSQGTIMPQFEANLDNNLENIPYYSQYGAMNLNPSHVKYEENRTSFGSMDSLEMQPNERQWGFQEDADDLQSLAFRYINQHS